MSERRTSDWAWWGETPDRSRSVMNVVAVGMEIGKDAGIILVFQKIGSLPLGLTLFDLISSIQLLRAACRSRCIVF
jgi:hypothetical protein